MNLIHSQAALKMISDAVSAYPLTVHSCLLWIDQLASTHQVLRLHFTAAVFLYVAYKTSQGSLTEELLDVLATMCLQSNDARRCVNARHSSVLSLSQAAVLMNVVVNSSHSTVQLIEIELSKAYLHRALRCKDSDRGETESIINNYMDTSKLVDLLQWSAVEHLTTCRELEARNVDTDFKAVYAYKCGQYQHCLQLSIRKLTAVKDRGVLGRPVIIHPLLIQLLDDDIVSLIGRRESFVIVHPLSLSLYLTAQCQIKLRHSPTSLATTLDNVPVARARFKHRQDKLNSAIDHVDDCDINQLLLTFVEQKILRYISAAERRNATIRGPRHFLRSGPLPSDLKLWNSRGAPYHQWGPRH